MAERGQQVASIDCPQCGSDIPILLNKNLIAYGFCRGRHEAGGNCSFHLKYGRTDSQRLIAEAAKNDHQEPRPPEGDGTGEPSTGGAAAATGSPASAAGDGPESAGPSEGPDGQPVDPDHGTPEYRHWSNL